MNEYVVQSTMLQSEFDIKAIDLKFGRSIKELQKFSFKKVYQAASYLFRIAGNIISYKPQLIYFTVSPTGFAFYRDASYILLMKLLRAKILIHLHGKGIDKASHESKVKRSIYKIVFKNIRIICLSDRLSEDIKNVYNGIPFIVPNGIRVENLSNHISRPDTTVPEILYLSNFIKNKGVLILLDALNILKNNGYQFKTVLVGAPSDVTNEMLENTMLVNGLNNYIQVAGPLLGEEKFKAYKAADLFVFPTYNDSFPLVTLEAMQFGLPVISTFEGSIPDIVVDNETGMLVERENSNTLAEKIGELLRDAEKRKCMGQKGRERFLNNYTMDHFEKNMFSIFKELLN